MGAHDALDLGRVDVDAVMDHDTVGPAEIDQLAVGRPSREIAGMEPAVPEMPRRGLGVAPVALDHAGAADAHAAIAPVGNPPSVRVDDLQLDAGDDPSHGARRLVELGRLGEGEMPGLVGAVVDPQPIADPGPQPRPQRVADRGPGGTANSSSGLVRVLTGGAMP